MQYCAEKIEKPMVFLCFLNSDCKKHWKTYGFLQYFAEQVEKPKVFLCFLMFQQVQLTSKIVSEAVLRQLEANMSQFEAPWSSLDPS